jgi:hypothetical protein
MMSIYSAHGQTVIPLAGYQATVEGWPVAVNDSILSVRLTINDYSNQFNGTDLIGRDHIVLWRNCKRYVVVSIDTAMSNYVVLQVHKSGNAFLLPGVCALVQETGWIVSHLINGVTDSDHQCIDSYYRNNSGGSGGGDHQYIYIDTMYGNTAPLYITGGDTVRISGDTGLRIDVPDSVHMTVYPSPPYGDMMLISQVDNMLGSSEMRFPFANAVNSNCGDISFDPDYNRLVLSSTAGGYYRIAYNMDVANKEVNHYLGISVYVKVNGIKKLRTVVSKYLGICIDPDDFGTAHIGRDQFLYIPSGAYVELYYQRYFGDSPTVAFTDVIFSIQFVSKFNCNI